MKKLICLLLLVASLTFAGCGKPIVIEGVGDPVPCGSGDVTITGATVDSETNVELKANWKVGTEEKCSNVTSCSITVPSCTILSGEVKVGGYESIVFENVNADRNAELTIKMVPKKLK